MSARSSVRLAEGLAVLGLSLLAPAPVLADAFDLAAVALTADDLGGTCQLVDVQEGYAPSVDSGIHGGFYQCGAPNIVLGGSVVLDELPLVVVNLVAASDSRPSASVLEDLLTQGLSAMSGEDGSEVAVLSSGPTIGEISDWYRVTAQGVWLRYDGYLVAFTRGSLAALVFSGGFLGQESLDRTAYLARLVESRINF